MNRLVEEIAPGGRLVRSRRLRGGLGARMHVLTIEDAAGGRSNVVLRRYRTEWSGSTPQDAAYEFRVLALLEQTGLPAPRPLWLDADGRVFSVPAVALSYLPGSSFRQHANVEAWLRRMAEALLAVHAITPDRHDLSWLHDGGRDGLRLKLQRWQSSRHFDDDPLASQVYDAVSSRLESVQLAPQALIHDDFWPGNTVWNRGRLAGIIDWGGARLGDPRVDVAQCRIDLVISHGIAAADVFLAAYESALGRSLPDMPFFDLFVGLPALLYLPIWISGYHDAGWTHLTVEASSERIQDLLRRRLSELST